MQAWPSVTGATPTGDTVSTRPWDSVVNEGNMAHPLGINHIFVQTYYHSLGSVPVGTEVSTQVILGVMRKVRPVLQVEGWPGTDGL